MSMRKWILFALPFAVAISWAAFAPNARATGCSSWSDLILTIDTTVANPAARTQLLDAVDVLQNAPDCFAYEQAAGDYAMIVMTLCQTEQLTDSEANITDACWLPVVNSSGGCGGVIADQSSSNFKKCNFDAGECEVLTAHHCVQTVTNPGKPGEKRTCRN